ncbi:MAG: hypothetical protein R6W78_17695, partial [Bacteroidales bacterium]
MKKVLQVLAILVLTGMIAAPAIANINTAQVIVAIDDEPAKKDAKSDDKQESKKKGECTKSASEKPACTKATSEKPAC